MEPGDPMRLLVWLVGSLGRLLRDLLPRSHEGEDEDLARQDDVLDAWLDEDEVDATGL